MTLTGIKFIITGAEEKAYQKKMIRKVKDSNGHEKEVEELLDKTYKRCKIQFSPYDTPFMIGCSKLVEDGVYLCGLKLDHDFDRNRDYVSLIVGDRVNG